MHKIILYFRFTIIAYSVGQTTLKSTDFLTTFLRAFLFGEFMEYIEKEKAIEVLTEFLNARERRKNCSTQAAIEYGAFKYCIEIIKKLPVKEINEGN